MAKLYFALTTIGGIFALLFASTTVYMIFVGQKLGLVLLAVLITLIFVWMGDFTYSKYKGEIKK